MSHLPEPPVDRAARAALSAYLRTLQDRAQPRAYRAPLLLTVNTIPLGIVR